mmetsp:Transcript_15747/g.38039  ORF Transcript_15747/g.38039 Transcript_15747/m.38039 type:complete len:136 (-) Transcript_15747:11-418(-)
MYAEVKKRTGVPPYFTVLSVLSGVYLFGVSGVVYGPVLINIVPIVYRDLVLALDPMEPLQPMEEDGAGEQSAEEDPGADASVSRSPKPPAEKPKRDRESASSSVVRRISNLLASPSRTLSLPRDNPRSVLITLRP